MSAKILIVDDSGLSRRTLKRILEASRYEVTEATDGMSALERYFVDRPTIVFLDLTMEGLTGPEVLRKLREMDPDVKVVVATADIQESTHDMAADAGASGYVTKPFAADQVISAIEQVLAGGGNANHRPTK
jgi:two-component system, chemotaxis family, chemotaxis protein CheY